jgi:hypothetical protein
MNKPLNIYAPQSKVAAVKITINRAEGRITECNQPVCHVLQLGVSIWDMANRTLSSWATTAPKGGGYDKCDFTVEYADGRKYEGRYDLKHRSEEAPDLQKHIESFVMCYSGLRKPSSIPQENYVAILARNQQATDWMKEHAEKYEI